MMMLAAMVMAFGSQTPPYTLMVFNGSGGIAMNTYHSIWSCQKARDALLEAVGKDNQARARNRSGMRLEITAYCIPG
jgi:hypothetical protein